MVHKDNNIRILFGNKSNSINLYSNDIKENIKPVLPSLLSTLNFNTLSFVKQVHGIDHFIPAGECDLEIPNHTGDIILTDKPGIAIGVLTADCLPIVLTSSKGIAVIHAGWKGSVLGIAKQAVELMLKNFGTNASDIQAYFGPSAKVCCYEVKSDFYSNLYSVNGEQFVIQRDNKLYFDNVAFNKRELLNAGVVDINYQYNDCTVCNLHYCSYRRGDEKNRQFTVVLSD